MAAEGRSLSSCLFLGSVRSTLPSETQYKSYHPLMTEPSGVTLTSPAWSTQSPSPDDRPGCQGPCCEAPGKLLNLGISRAHKNSGGKLWVWCSAGPWGSHAELDVAISGVRTVVSLLCDH